MALSLAMLGLDANATAEDFIKGIKELLGDKAANAYIESVMGSQVEAEEVLDNTATPDPMVDDMAGRSTDLITQLTNLINRQQVAPRTAAGAKVANDKVIDVLRAEIVALREAVLGAPVDDNPTARRDRNGGSNPTAPQFSVRDLRYDGASATDLAYAVKLLESRGHIPSDSLYRAVTIKIADEIEKGTPTGSDLTVQYLSPFRSRSEVMASDIKSIRSMGVIRANEVMGDANTGFGSNYVGVFYDTSLWLKVRLMPIWREFMARGMEEKVIPVGYASDVIPLEGADFTWYRVPETVDVDSTGRPKINITPTQAGTSSTTLVVRTLGALVYYSVLLEEDSIVPMAAELNRKANIQVQEQIEYVMLNGDTATGTGNLNFKNGTVSSSNVSNFTVADGMLKSALIGNSGLNARTAAGLSDLDYQLLFAKLGNNGITGSDPTKLLFVVDPQTGLATDRLPIVKTKDINSAATVERGHVTEMYGVPILRSGQMALADSTGYIDSVTASNNSKGRILSVRPDQWVSGFKRQVAMEYFRDVPGQSNGMVITLRFGMQLRDATQAAAATYNVTVA